MKKKHIKNLTQMIIVSFKGIPRHTLYKNNVFI